MLLGMLFLFNVSAVDAGIAVVVNPGSGVTSLSAKEVKGIFLGKQKKFPNGTKTHPAIQKDSNEISVTFAKNVLGKSQSQLKAYWAKLIFSGKGAPPRTVDDDAATKAFVSNTPGGIGFMDNSKVDTSVKVVFTAK